MKIDKTSNQEQKSRIFETYDKNLEAYKMEKLK